MSTLTPSSVGEVTLLVDRIRTEFFASGQIVHESELDLRLTSHVSKKLIDNSTFGLSKVRCTLMNYCERIRAAIESSSLPIERKIKAYVCLSFPSQQLKHLLKACQLLLELD